MIFNTLKVNSKVLINVVLFVFIFVKFRLFCKVKAAGNSKINSKIK